MMHASLRSLLDAVAEFELEQRLIELTSSACMVCDEAFGEWLATIPGAKLLPLRSTRDGLSAAAGEQNVIVCVRNDESTWLESVRQALPHASVLGVFRDVLPALVTKRQPTADTIVNRRYLIVCPPRSGSYFLSGLLANAGVGAPREHLRSSICQLARSGCLSLLDFLSDLEKSGTVDGTFGTKIISHYAFEAIDSGLPADVLLDYLHKKSFRTIHLVRANRIERAVSFYFASTTGVWTTARKQEQALPDYDFERIYESYRFLAEQEDLLRQFLGLLPNVLEVHYEDLDRNTAEVFRQVLQHLGVNAKVELPQPTTARQRGEHSLACAAQFQTELASRGMQ
jgi:LPS sulfotransferase NodH